MMFLLENCVILLKKTDPGILAGNTMKRKRKVRGMLQEVFELMMQVHSGMKIACVGLMDGTKIQRELINDGNRETRVNIELVSTDVGFAVFSRKSKSSYIYNDVVTGETSGATKLAVPYSNISYMEFTDEEE